MRLIITLVLVILATFAGWHFYPSLFSAISGKEAPLRATTEKSKKTDAAQEKAPAEASPEAPETSTAPSA